MASRLVAIHQPNFLPWLGYFEKLARADVFVLLDNVQFSKGSYTNRVRVLVNGEPRWLTAIETIRHAYARAPRFDEVFPSLEPLLRRATDRLAAYNEGAIRELAARVAPEGAELVRASSLEVSGTGTDLLVEIVAAVGGDAYLVGGAGGYQEDKKLQSAGIELARQRFSHPDSALRESSPDSAM